MNIYCRIINKIGEGAFSTVSKGLWTDGSSVYEVAVKELIKQSTKEDKIKMLQEAAILGQFRHPNVIKLFGVVKHGSAVSVNVCFLCMVHCTHHNKCQLAVYWYIRSPHIYAAYDSD